MARKNESILNDLVLFPWWVSVVIAIIVYTILKFIVPAMTFENPILAALAQTTAPQLAWVAGIFLLPAAASALE